MIDLEFISNTKKKLKYVIENIFEWAEEIDIAVAFLKSSGYNIIKDIVKEKTLRLLIGIDFCLTDTEPLQDIFDKGYHCKIYKTPMSNEEKSYRTKIYIAKRKNEVRVVIGSSNLTNGGFYSNVEGNVLLCGNKTEPIIKEILEFFEEKWKGASAKNLNEDLINQYSDLKQEFESHNTQIYSKPSFVLKKDELSSKGNSLIICMTKEHDQGDIYNRLVGVPMTAKKIAFENIKKGTRLFIYYIGQGISKVVEAFDEPYIDDKVVAEWKDAYPETYPIRVKTRLLYNYASHIKLSKLQELGICRVDTGIKIVPFHLQSSLTPISDNDGDTIEYELSK